MTPSSVRLGAALAGLLALVPLLAPGPLHADQLVQRRGVRLHLNGAFSPGVLPRAHAAPIAVEVGGRISTADGSSPPQLRRLEIDVNRNARFDPTGLATCTYAQLQPTTTAGALAACGAAKVGEGSFAADVAIPEQSPFPSRGRLVAFNGTEAGRPVIFAHVYGSEPVPTSYTLALRMLPGHGAYGTVLSAALPRVTSEVAFVTEITLRLHRRYRYRGASRSYISAACAAPPGFSGAPFPLAHTTFGFAGGLSLGATLPGYCKVGR